MDVKSTTESRVRRLDALLKARWGERCFEFGAKIKALSTPQAIADATREIRQRARDFGVLPLVIVPYLNPERLAELEGQGVSGIDLCGNGVVVVPGELLIDRTGRPNLFPAEGTIKNVYRGASSIVARLFLLVPEFESVQEALAAISSRGGKVTLGTVSKVCSRLQDDLLIERKRGPGTDASRRLRLLQPEALLEKLAQNYAPPEAPFVFTGKSRLSSQALRERLRTWEAGQAGKMVRTGETSVGAYAVMAREPIESFYCTDLRSLLADSELGVVATDRFPDIRFVETQDEAVYFDRRENLQASPIQVYLELAHGDKRQRETAAHVKRAILAPLERPSLPGKEA